MSYNTGYPRPGLILTTGTRFLLKNRTVSDSLFYLCVEQGTVQIYFLEPEQEVLHKRKEPPNTKFNTGIWNQLLTT